MLEDLRRGADELIETHISWVFLRADEVFKVKKPVDLGFLDFTSPEKRRAACEAEVELNRRLAPGVYLGVVPVTREDDGRHGFGGDGEAVDWAVKMVRLDDASRADALLERGRLGFDDVEALAEQVADFHARSARRPEIDRFGETEHIAVNVVENFEQTRESLGRYLEPAACVEIEAWQRNFLAAQGELFERRIREGRVRDGHGDLRLEHVYFDERREPVRATIVDCIEFNDRFRYADVCADVAFLAMDLAWHGRVDLAEAFLAAYALAANDYDLYPLVDFYESYRAFVRGKIATFGAADTELPVRARERHEAEARRYFLLALASERRSLLPPAVVAVGGIIASGKSTVARHLARELGAPVVEADRTRKFLSGVEPEEKMHVPAWQGPYTPERTEEVYRELRRRAGAVLEGRRPVVLDASFRSRSRRAEVREFARERGVPFYFVECRAGAAVCRGRLERRAREGGVSDGRLEIFDDFAASWQEVDELGASEHLALDTERPLAESLDALREFVATWPSGLTD